MSSSKLIPPNPSSVSVIRAVTPNITTVSAPFLRFGLFKVGGRGTIVKLTNGTLAVFSPTALTPEVRSTLERLGNDVRYIAALDMEHHIFLSEWAKAFPRAAVMGPEGLREKREGSEETKGTAFTYIFTAKDKASMKIDEAFDKDFDYEFVDAHGNKELVFNYKPDRTLIQADLIFNLPATEQYAKSGTSATSGIMTKLFSSFMHTRGAALGQKRFLWYTVSKADRPGFAKSMENINGWDFDRIIPCHGDVTEAGGKQVFQTVMEWYLQGKSS